MSEAGSLPVGSWVFLGQSLYSVATIGVDVVILVHNCPDGTQRLVDLGPHDTVETARERLTVLRGELDRATERARRQWQSPVRRELARHQRDSVAAQITELEELTAPELVAADRKEQANG